MSISVITNGSALTALQNLNKTNDDLAMVQSRINTGLRIANAKDNAAVWSIAQGQRADIGALGAVKMSLDRAKSIADVAMSAGESVSDLLVQLKEKVVAAMDPSLDAASRTAMNSDYKSILRQITQVVQNSAFDGANILDNSIPAGIKFLANADANAFITLSSKNLTLGGAVITPTQILILGVTASLAQTTTSVLADTLNASKTGAVSLGTAAASSTTLNSTMADLLPSTAFTSSATIDVAGSAVTAALAASAHFDGTGTAKDLYINTAVVTDGDLDADATIEWDGTILVTWINLGDY